MGERKNTNREPAQDADVYEAMQEPAVFADLFNGSIFQGEQIIRPEMLEPANEKGILKAEPFGKNPAVLYRIKDVSRNAVLAGSLLRIILNVEGQKNVHYGMPVRIMTYDAVGYSQEVRELSRKNRREKKLQGSAEFLSGLKKGDKIQPMLDIVFYYGEEQDWDGPLSLHEMLAIPPEAEKWKQYIPDYRINLVCSKTVNPEHFRTGLREVFELLGVMADKNQMEQLLKEKETHYANLDMERGRLISSFLDVELPENNDVAVNGGKVDMCTAIKEMIREGEEKGEERISKLVQQLLAQQRYTDLENASKNKDYRKKLLEEFKL